MEPEVHLFTSAALTSAAYFITGNIPAAVAAFFGGFFIDLDHLLEYWLYKKSLVIRGEFFTKYAKKAGHLYIFFHSYEVLLAVYFVAMLTRGLFSEIALWLAIGMTLHMVLDILGNNVWPKTYSLIYRIYRNFGSEHFYKR